MADLKGKSTAKKENLETTAIFTPEKDGYAVTFPAVPGLVFYAEKHSTDTDILEEIEDAYDLQAAKNSLSRNDFVRWEDVRDDL